MNIKMKKEAAEYKGKKFAKETENEPQKKGPLIKHPEGVKWYDYQFDETVSVDEAKSQEKVDDFLKKAEYWLKKDVELHEQLSKTKNKSDAAWLETVMQKGTHEDRISAMQLKVHQSPVHAIAYLNLLIGVVQKKALRESASVIKVLTTVFVDELLPERKLIPFNMRPLKSLERYSKQDGTAANRRLIMWKFESDLKECYHRFVSAVEAVASSPVEGVAEQAVGVLMQMLSERPEQEQFLLTALANKLGHPNHKVGSKTAYQLERLVQKHPNMRLIVVKEVERLVFRKNISEKAQLYAVHFLSRIILNAGESELAVKLLQIYFALFRILIVKNQKNHRLLSLVVSGANRALPYAKEKTADLTNEVDSLYNIVHTAKLTTALSALRLLFQMLNYSEGLSDRFYSALYRKLLTVHSSSHDAQLLVLLYKVLSTDNSDNRVRAFIKRLLQLALSSSPSFSAAVLLLYGKLLESRPSLMRLSKSANRHIDVKIEQGIAEKKEDSDSDEEHYVDVDEEKKPAKTYANSFKANANHKKFDDEEEDKDEETKSSTGNAISQQPKGWMHRPKAGTKRQDDSIYQPLARNPLFANAELSVDSELLALSQHYHPSVAVFAGNIIDGIPLKYSGDPLVDFTLIRFLDRFAFKNPKGKANGAHSAFDHKYEAKGVRTLTPSSKEYVDKRINEIPMDERYLHRFASMRLGKKTVEKKDDDIDFDDAASVNSDEFDLIMQKFEPGEANEVFDDVDFSKEFGVEKTQKEQKAKKRERDEISAAVDDGNEDDDEDDDIEGDDEYGSELEDEDNEGEEEEDDEEEDYESDDDEEFERPTKKSKLADSSDDEEFDGSRKLAFAEDAMISAEKMDEFLEEEELRAKKSKKQVRKPRGFKKHRR